MKTKSITFQSRLGSFRYAWKGVIEFFRQEPNAKIHLAASSLVAVAIIFFPTTHTEKIALLIVTGGVWVSEIFNTAIERMMDFISTEHDPKIGLIKDLAAGAVLFAAMIAAITGAIIFIPKLS